MNKLKQLAAAAFLSLTAAMGTAHAALTAADITPITTEASADATLVFSSYLPIIGTVLAMFIGIRLLKRFSNKV